jgi:hypothetical protein
MIVRSNPFSIGFVLNDQFWALFDIFKIGGVEIPAITARVEKDPAIVRCTSNPTLKGVGDIKNNRGGICGDFPEGETVFVTRGFEPIGRYSIDEGIPRRCFGKRDEHPMEVDSRPLIESAHIELRRLDPRVRGDLLRTPSDDIVEPQ